MKGIVVTTINTMYIKDFGEPLYKSLGKEVGGRIEVVHPRRLYAPFVPFVMIVNEEGRLEGLPQNAFGSFLYGTRIHGEPIVGNIIILQEGFVNGERDIIGLDDNLARYVIDKISDITGGKITEVEVP